MMPTAWLRALVAIEGVLSLGAVTAGGLDYASAGFERPFQSTLVDALVVMVACTAVSISGASRKTRVPVHNAFVWAFSGTFVVLAIAKAIVGRGSPSVKRASWAVSWMCAMGAQGISLLISFAFARKSGQYGSAGAIEEPLLEAVEKGQAKPAKRAKAMHKIVAFCKEDIHLIFGASIALIVAAMAAASVPHFAGKAVDAAAIEKDRQKLGEFIAMLVTAALVAGVGAGIRGSLFTLQGARLNNRVRENLFHALIVQEIGFFDESRSGELSSRLNNDTSRLADGVSLNTNVLARSAINALGILAFMVYTSWRLTLVSLLGLAPSILVYQIYGQKFQDVARKSQEALATANSAAEETIGNIKTVRSFADEENAISKYRHLLSHFLSHNIRQAWVYSGYAALLNALPRLVTALVVGYGGSLAYRGTVNPGALVSFLIYQESLTEAITGIADVATQITQAIGAAEKIFELIDRPPLFNHSPPGGEAPESFEAKIELQAVTLRYPLRPEHPALWRMSLTCENGEMCALVGPSGGGKSSVVKVLQRYYLPEEGDVFFGDRKLEVLDNTWLRRNLTIVPQIDNIAIFNCSIRENILYGLADDEFDDPHQHAVEAAKKANADGFIRELGYDTVVGENGVLLSGGQKQRIAIARALAREPRAVIFDEPTSALDAESEHVVQDALQRAMEDRTTMIIAHRLSTIRRADKICVIKGGQIIEQGSHETLVASGGVYSSLIEKQRL